MADEIKNQELNENQLNETQPEEQPKPEIETTQPIPEEKPELDLNEIDKKLDEDIDENELSKLKEQLKTNFSNYRENKNKIHTIRIDEKYISEQPPEIQKILRPIKGDILSERALKNYINAQLFIEKQKSQKQEVAKETTPPQVYQQNQINVQPSEDLNRALYLTLRVKYSDLPELTSDTNPEEQLKDYLTDLQISDPIKYYKFLKDYDLATQKIQEQISQYKYIEENWEHISAENIKKDVQKFENDLKEFGLSLQDLGLNLELDDKYYNEYLYNNILLKNNEANPEVVQRISDKALLIPEGAVYKKLIELNFKNVLQLAKSKNVSSGINKKVPPSMSTYYSTGKTGKTSIPVEDLLDLPSYEIDDEALQKAKEQIKSQIVGLK